MITNPSCSRARNRRSTTATPRARDEDATSDSRQHEIAGYLNLNFRPGDEHLIESSLVVVDDDDSSDAHHVLLDTLTLLEKNDTADCSRLGQMIYFHTPCDICRSSAAELLLRKNAAPSWLSEEVQFDANPAEDGE